MRGPRVPAVEVHPEFRGSGPPEDQVGLHLHLEHKAPMPFFLGLWRAPHLRAKGKALYTSFAEELKQGQGPSHPLRGWQGTRAGTVQKLPPISQSLSFPEARLHHCLGNHLLCMFLLLSPADLQHYPHHHTARGEGFIPWV